MRQIGKVLSKVKKVVEQINKGIDRLFRSLNAFFERCEAYGKRHAAGIGRAAHALGKAERWLALVLLLYVTLFQLDGYRYLLSLDAAHPPLYTLGILIIRFILPFGALMGLGFFGIGNIHLRPFGHFLKKLAEEIACGILIAAALTGFWGYCFEYSAAITAFACLAVAWLIILIAEKLLHFLFLAEAEVQDGVQIKAKLKAAPKEGTENEK